MSKQTWQLREPTTRCHSICVSHVPYVRVMSHLSELHHILLSHPHHHYEFGPPRFHSNFQIFRNILINFCNFPCGGPISKSRQIPGKRFKTVGNHDKLFSIITIMDAQFFCKQGFVVFAKKNLSIPSRGFTLLRGCFFLYKKIFNFESISNQILNSLLGEI